MELLALLAGALITLLIALALSRGVPDPPEEPAPRAGAERVDRLCSALSGEAEKDRPMLNRILALGNRVIPALVDGIAELRVTSDGPDAKRLAILEELIADFGLSAVPPVCDTLLRLQLTASMTPSLLRVIERLGEPGLRSFAERALHTPELGVFLPRFRARPHAARAVAAVLRGRPLAIRSRDLEVLAGLVVTLPETLDLLLDESDPPGWAATLRFLADWLPLARPEHVAKALECDDAEVRVAGAELARLLVDPRLIAPLTACAGAAEVACRRAAVEALAAQPGGESALIAAVGDAEAEVALAALLGLIDGAPGVFEAALERASALPAPMRALLEAPGEVGALLPALGVPALAELAARLLGRLDKDPRAREGLIVAAGGEAAADRVHAIRALGLAGDETAPELLPRVVREAGGRHRLALLQEAAQHMGAAAALPLARRLRPNLSTPARASLVVLRALPFSPAVPPLLRAFEDTCSRELDALIAATLAAGGEPARAVIDEALHNPARGLLTSALRYIAAYGGAEDLPLLLHLHERHWPLRGALLNLIELHGPEAHAALSARVAAGGDEALLEGFERRLEVLAACKVESF